MPFFIVAAILGGVALANRAVRRRLVAKHERFESLIAERTLE